MSISPINFNGMIQNTNELSSSKVHEDQKSVLQQANISEGVQKKQEQTTHQVTQSSESDKSKLANDREGDGTGYQKQKKNKQNNSNSNDANNMKSDGKVTKKSSSSFDIRI